MLGDFEDSSGRTSRTGLKVGQTQLWQNWLPRSTLGRSSRCELYVQVQQPEERPRICLPQRVMYVCITAWESNSGKFQAFGAHVTISTVLRIGSSNARILHWNIFGRYIVSISNSY